MGRWAYLDTDEERLPEGMTRIGYDADSQTYTYRDSDGSRWTGAPGNRYGHLSKVSGTSRRPSYQSRVTEKKSSKKDRDSYSSDDDNTLNEKTDLETPNDARPTFKHSLLKPLPSLPTSAEQSEDDSLEKPTPRGEEHRYKRRQARDGDKQKLERRSTVSRIAGYLSRNSSPQDSTSSNGSHQRKRLVRSSTMRDREKQPIGRKRATTFDDMLAPNGRLKE
ncbi:hypothetical protein GQ53DRAFT_761419 [Thozetella sp. PMI_491]|nr:hypothetical protein GQ53DRAFT_761419 [Thozetella sp. PMI_491]